MNQRRQEPLCKHNNRSSDKVPSDSSDEQASQISTPRKGQDYSQATKNLKAANLSWDTYNGELMAFKPHVKWLCSTSLYYMQSYFQAFAKNSKKLCN